MLKKLIGLCLRGGDPKDPGIRRRCGAISGGMGIGLNLLLFAGKLLAGILSGSVAMVADAVNNLSDAATSVVTLVGFRLAGQQSDADHPFGHGRIEYITGLLVSLAVLLMGVEIGRSSVEALLRPQNVQMSLLTLVILVAAILIKLWIFVFNRALGRAIDSQAMAATAADALSDMASTGAVLLSAIVGQWTRLPIDGAAGLLVAVLILKTGWEAAQATLAPLLGRPMDPELAADIDRIVLGHDKILGIHDLVYHDYGPGRAMMSFHAEVPADENLLEIHDIIDHIERELKARHGIDTVIHMDPVVCDARTTKLRSQVEQVVHDLDPALSIHDFRMTPGPIHTNLIFDIEVPYGFRLTDRQVTTEVGWQLKKLSPRYYPVIQIDHPYIKSPDPEQTRAIWRGRG